MDNAPVDNSPARPLNGRTVLVTGGTRGVGAGIARAFVEAGADVLTCARRPPEDPVKGTEFSPSTCATRTPYGSSSPCCPDSTSSSTTRAARRTVR